MSIASKLKDLVIKWGGQPTKDDDSIEELIALLAELDAPSGGSGVLVVHSTYDESTQTVTLDKTWQEIYDASHNGAFVVSTAEAEHGETIFGGYMTGIDDVRGYHVHFLSCYYDAATSEMTYERMSFTASGPDAYPANSGQ